MKTLSVVDSGVAGETVFVLLPLPLELLVSVPKLFDESLALLELSGFSGDAEPSARPMPFDELSVMNLLLSKYVSIAGKYHHYQIRLCHYRHTTYLSQQTSTI